MTDTTTAAAPQATSDEVPDIGFSVHELHYLLSISPGESADRSAELLNVAPVPSVDESILIGGASLLTSGRLEVLDDGSFAPRDAALIVAFILTTADRWTLITGATDTAVDLGVFIESPSGAVLAQPRTLGTWWFVLLDPSAEPGEVLVDTVFGLADAAEHSGVTVRTGTRTDDRTLSVRRLRDDWAYGVGQSDRDTPDELVESVSRPVVEAAVRAFIAGRAAATSA
jgi:hypothetical protein